MHAWLIKKKNMEVCSVELWSCMIRQLLRVTVFLLGILLMAMGVAVSIRADLGTSPIASFPTVLSFGTSLSVGVYMILLNIVFIALQMLILRRKFPVFQLIQLPVSIVFGLFIDLSMYLTQWLVPGNYIEQWVWTAVSVILVALGVYFEMQPRISYLPGNGLVFTIYTKLQNIPYGTIKTTFDTTLVVVSVVTSLLLMGQLNGVREGTVFAAITVGIVIRGISAIHKRWGGAKSS